MSPKLKKKDKFPFALDQVVRATRSFAWEGGTVNQGERFRASHPAVQAGWSNFVDGDVPDHELENMWDTLPPPPEHVAPVRIEQQAIPGFRVVVSMVDITVPTQWAPDSYGEKFIDAPPAFARATLRRGQSVDALSEVVKQNPTWFRWPERDVLPADLERLEKLERLEQEG